MTHIRNWLWNQIEFLMFAIFNLRLYKVATISHQIPDVVRSKKYNGLAIEYPGTVEVTLYESNTGVRIFKVDISNSIQHNYFCIGISRHINTYYNLWKLRHYSIEHIVRQLNTLQVRSEVNQNFDLFNTPKLL